MKPASLAMAFQPIVDAGSRDVFAYEALVRGVDGESAESASAIPAAKTQARTTLPTEGVRRGASGDASGAARGDARGARPEWRTGIAVARRGAGA